MTNRIAEAARRAAETLESRSFFAHTGRPPDERTIAWDRGAGDDRTVRTVRCLVHRECPERARGAPRPPVVSSQLDSHRYCSACGFAWSDLALVDLPHGELERIGLLYDVITELRFAAAFGAQERREALRPHHAEAQAPPDVEPLAPGNPHRMPIYRPGR